MNKMKTGHFKCQLNASWKLLRGLGLASVRVPSPDYTAGLRATLEELNHLDVWKCLTERKWYDFQLTDLSLVQFRYQSPDPYCVSFAYFPCPLEIMPFRDFVRSNAYIRDYAYASPEEQYQDYVQSSPLRPDVMPIRYDSDPNSYRPGVHPASHLHFGSGNHIRLSARRYWRPLSFSLFVLRQCYPVHWERLLGFGKPTLYGNVRDALPEVPDPHWQPFDTREVSLH